MSQGRRAIKSHTDTPLAEEADVTSRHPDISLVKGKNWVGASEPEKFPISSVDPWAVYCGRDKKDQKTISKI